MLKNTLIAAVALAALSGCSSVPREQDIPYVSDPLLATVQSSVDDLAAQLKQHNIAYPLVVASAQNNDELARVCPQGRLIADVVSSRLTQKGFAVTEVKVTKDLRVTNEGETILSRDLRQLATSVASETVVTATWTTIGEQVKFGAHGATRYVPGASTYVTLKAIRITDGRVLGSQTFASPIAWGCK